MPSRQPRLIKRSSRSRVNSQNKKSVNSINLKSWNALSQTAPQSMRCIPKIHRVQQSFVDSITTSASVPVHTSKYIAFNLFDQYTQFGAVFDQYKIERVEFFLTPEGASSTLTGTYVAVVDLDDATDITTLAAGSDYENALILSPTSGYYANFIPHLAVGEYSSSLNSYGNFKPTWIDCTSSAVQHYGVKLFFNTQSVATVYSIRVRAQLAFRNIR